MQSVLCADIGTTSLKIGIISEDGEVVAFSKRLLNTQDTSYIANQWVQAFINGTKECISNLSNNIKICALSISGNGPSIVSKNGRTLLWNSPLLKEIQTSERTAKSHSLFLPQLKAFKTFFPDEWDQSPFLFSGPEFLIYRLTQNAITLLPEERFLPTYWTDDDIKQFGIEKEKIPPFITLCTQAGSLTNEYAVLTGLSSGIPVFCAGPDFVAALIGTGTLKPGRICDRAGSSEGINYCSAFSIRSPELRTLPSVIPGLWNISYIIPESGSLLTEFKNEISSLENKEITYSQIIEYAFSDKNSEGWRILSEIKDKNLFALKKIQELCKENNLQIDDKIMITGGQSNTPRWLNEKATALNIKLTTSTISDAELLGNAIVAFTALKKFSSLQEAAEKIVKEKEVFYPQKEAKVKYKIYKIPQNLKTIIFDIDSTLYTSASYAFEQVDAQIRFWAKKQNITEAEARNKISEFRKNWSASHDGKKISLGNAFTHFGVTIQESIEMRRNLLEPKNFLQKDKLLIKTLSSLSKKYKLICVTNNPVLPARKTLDAIGVSHLIKDIVGLDTCGKSKPAIEPFKKACELTATTAEECLAVGDRYDMDIALPLQMGMGGILVSGVKDVYEIPALLTQNN